MMTFTEQLQKLLINLLINWLENENESHWSSLSLGIEIAMIILSSLG